MALDWQTHQLRLTLFSKDFLTPSEAIWKLITGQEEAEQRIAIPGGKQYVGSFLDGALAVGIAANRLDIVLSHGGEPNADAELPCFGSFSHCLKEFVDASHRVFADLKNPINRIAFGGVLMCPMGTREESYETIGKLVPSLKVDPNGMRELLFRVNWPAKSKSEVGLEINRLTTWSTLAISRGSFNVSNESQLNVMASSKTVYATRLDIDHNTTQSRADEFETSKIPTIFSELVDLALENASAGERP